MQDVLMIPDGALADACLSFARETESRLILEHSIRSFHYARLVADHEGSVKDSAYDDGLLFAACVLHDLGLGTRAAGEARFEVEGADLAAALLAEQGLPTADIERVWEAIALHASIGLADRMGLLTYLTHRGVFIDGGRDTDIPPKRLQIIRTAYPRPANDTSIMDAIAEHAARSAAAAPPYSISAEVLRWRRAPS
jgi:hypothetical protein